MVKMKGTALGIFGSGNIDTAITTFCLPLLIVAIGWRGSYRVYGFTLLAAAAVYALVGRDAPHQWREARTLSTACSTHLWANLATAITAGIMQRAPKRSVNMPMGIRVVDPIRIGKVFKGVMDASGR